MTMNFIFRALSQPREGGDVRVTRDCHDQLTSFHDNLSCFRDYSPECDGVPIGIGNSLPSPAYYVRVILS